MQKKKESLIFKIYHKIENNRKLSKKFIVEDRSSGSDTICIILCGYKQILWDELFYRIKKFVPKNIDVCLLSSGLYSEELSNIAKNNNWSYLSSKANKVNLIQNIALNYFKNAKNIFKLDEDIMVCEHFFESLIRTYDRVSNESHHKIGFVAPLLPLNGYCHIPFLKKINKIDEYEALFGKTFYGSNSDDSVMVNPEAAKFIWKQCYFIDDLANIFYSSDFEYSICHCRYSIGAIYFKRDIWEAMGMFKVNRTNGLGMDEVQLCSYCMLKSKAIIVSHNTLAGHFSFGPQNKVMEAEYSSNEMFKKLFITKEECNEN